MTACFKKNKEPTGEPLRKAVSCCVLAALALSGCAGSPSTRQGETLIDRGGVDILASDSTRQLTYLKERSSTERFCRGPGADSISTASEGVSLQLPLRGSSAGVGEETTTGAVDLGGRNPAVLITRELMYRACELASNTNADGATERQIYMQFLQAVAAISKAQIGPGISAFASEPAAPVLLAPPPAPASTFSAPTTTPSTQAPDFSASTTPPSVVAPASPGSNGPLLPPAFSNAVPGN
jgi:hypothetical protein